ncbi:ExbD/TolR family protein [Paludibacterium yongneupense]
MTPLVDVMLVLLIIFILTVPVLTHAVKLELPRAGSPPVASRPQTVLLSVQRDGTIVWNDEKLTPSALDARLAAAAAQATPPEIQIRGDRKAEYEAVLKVMAAAQQAGIVKLGFVTEPGT